MQNIPEFKAQLEYLHKLFNQFGNEQIAAAIAEAKRRFDLRCGYTTSPRYDTPNFDFLKISDPNTDALTDVLVEIRLHHYPEEEIRVTYPVDQIMPSHNLKGKISELFAHIFSDCMYTPPNSEESRPMSFVQIKSKEQLDNIISKLETCYVPTEADIKLLLTKIFKEPTGIRPSTQSIEKLATEAESIKIEYNKDHSLIANCAQQLEEYGLAQPTDFSIQYNEICLKNTGFWKLRKNEQLCWNRNSCEKPPYFTPKFKLLESHYAAKQKTGFSFLNRLRRGLIFGFIFKNSEESVYNSLAKRAKQRSGGASEASLNFSARPPSTS